MKSERIVQALYYLLILVLCAGVMSYNGEAVISPKIRDYIIAITFVSMIGFVVYYYLPKKRDHKT